MIIHRGGWKYGGDYEIFRLEDAPEEEYPRWNEAQEGDWVVSDDGWVMQCLKVQKTHYDERLIFPVAYRFRTQEQFLAQWHIDEGIYTTHKAGVRHSDSMPRRRKTKLAVELFVGYIMSGKPIDWQEIDRVMGTQSVFFAKRRFQNETVKKAVDDKLKAAFEEAGMDDTWVLERLRRAADIAEDKKDVRNMIEAVKTVGKYRDMEGRSQEKKEQLYGGAVFGQLREREQDLLPPQEEYTEATWSES